MTVDHLPGYVVTPDTRYRLKISTVTHEIDVADLPTLADAQLKYVRLRDVTGYGASQFSSGEIYDQNGHHVARISYNGRLWDAAIWTADMDPIAEAPELA